MKQAIYGKNENLFQSEDWRAFQESYGRKTIDLGRVFGVTGDLPFGKKFVWCQKGPQKISDLEPSLLGRDRKPTGLFEGTVFVRVEPETVSEKEIKKYALRRVGPGSLLSGQVSPATTRVLEISGSEEELLAAMKSKTRYNIRLAERKGVTVRISDDERVLCDLLSKTAGRNRGYVPYEERYYTEMIGSLSGKKIIRVFVAEKDGKPLAAIVVGFFGKTATYLHGGFDDSERRLMAPYLCHWEAIKYARRENFDYYDLWGVAETDDPQDPWRGITRFKEGFGGQKIAFPGGYDIVIDGFWYNILTSAARLRRLIKK